MNAIVIYTSKNGSTKAYASMIATRLKTIPLALKEINSEDLSEYDTIIYGGNIMGGKISGLDRFLPIFTKTDKRLVVFAVGMSKKSDEYTAKLKNDNLSKYTNIPLFYLRGAIDKNKLGFVPRKMVAMVLKPLRKKDDPDSIEMIEMFDNDGSFVCEENINELIKAL